MSSDKKEFNVSGGVASISKALSVMRLLGTSRFPLTMTEIAREADLTPSSCHDLVTTLVQIGFVQASSVSKSYETGARLVRLAREAVANLPDEGELQRRMNRFSDHHKAHLSVFRRFGQDRRISTLTAEGSLPIRIRLPVGQDLPLFSGAAGRIFASFESFESAQYEQLLHDIGINSKATKSEFAELVAQDRARGWSSGSADTQSGVVSLAVPVLAERKKLLGVLEATMFLSHYHEAPLDTMAAESLEIAQHLAKALG